jgi:hypothetical protein
MANDEIVEEQWYSCECYFIARIDGTLPEDALIEEVHFLTRAQAQEDAEQSAAKIARDKEHCYQNMQGQVVCWELLRMEEPKQIATVLTSGSEVFSRFLDLGQYKCLVEQSRDLSE